MAVRTVVVRLSGDVLDRLYQIMDLLPEDQKRRIDQATVSDAVRYCILEAPLPGGTNGAGSIAD
jgi:hypothetical protein